MKSKQPTRPHFEERSKQDIQHMEALEHEITRNSALGYLTRLAGCSASHFTLCTLSKPGHIQHRRLQSVAPIAPQLL